MIEASDVAVVIPTRGNVPLDQIIEPYGRMSFARVRVWNNGNGKTEDLGVYGRYAAIEKTNAPVILTQDDDVILPAATIQALLAAYEQGKVVCNVPERFRLRYKDSGMVGFGAIFDRDLPERAFNAFWRDGNTSPLVDEAEAAFLRLCDIVFTMLTPVVKLDLPYTELPYARDESRMWRQPGHFEECDAMRKLCREVRDG